MARQHVGAGDEIVISRDGAPLEHRAVADALRGDRRGAARRAGRTTRGELMLDEFDALLGPAHEARRGHARLERARHDQPGRSEIVELAHAHGVPVLIDGAQAVAHMPVDVQALDCDFYAFSGHKMFGPTGIGVLYGKAELLEAMPPYQGGGDMIRSVTFEKTTYNDAAVQVRGRHAEHRRRDRPGRGARLRRAHRHRRDRRARARAAGVRDRAC